MAYGSFVPLRYIRADQGSLCKATRRIKMSRGVERPRMALTHKAYGGRLHRWPNG